MGSRLLNNISAKLSRLIDVASTNTQLTNYVQQQLDRTADYFLHGEFQQSQSSTPSNAANLNGQSNPQNVLNNLTASTNGLNQQNHIMPDMAVLNGLNALNNINNLNSINSINNLNGLALNGMSQNINIGNNPLLAFPNNQIALTQAAIQGLVKQTQSVEKDRVRQKLAGFDPKTSPACNYINSKFGQDVRQHCLCEMAKYIAKKRQIVLDRDSKRRKSVLLKWFHDKWEIISKDMEFFIVQNDELIINDPDVQKVV
ncbi:hypothetical protein TRFO_42584 [Tritrichomonas foetus]|uniref:Uncharacterized protein n=1 Tax=Tritrichomonas foetus TaxID=1144522 RepID=A0A1J4KVK1_9EUKA|nr:hypothetical protein TRFO_42584 [Tritrichomonas foetus]|eukprot:OHT15337.1 hypothetical protein TRFO_42584 [Tritrichomonas foetus]